ncbi:MAG: flagellar protein FlgN [Rhodanobacter sp.]|nr:MAG: flagellar protein FlgN [Rhodanobacter sp.]TAM06742.1 MAG: flagellar protein FlgN [Rhodanobacter sp.]TAM40855.1 MAG: flagellar protein FlgN [Rhodanobacter sp.]TAN25745.1 MAG: flagellar protein FlgN [Rhodanobacter sp.]
MKTPLQHELNDALASVLDDMQHSANQLLTVLEAERSALDSVSTDALDQAGTRKQALMQQLEQLDAERQLLCREQPARQAALEPEWARVVQLLRHCHTLNQRNGSIVNQRLIRVRQALAILTGHPGERELYDRSGELHGSLRSQVLAAA